MSALQKLFSKQNIIRSWHEEKSRFRRRTTPGIDGVTRDQFAGSIELQAADIAERIASGSYVFRRLRPIPIPKENGKIRLINVPTIRDRLVQRIVLRFLVARYGPKWKLPQSFSSMGGDDEGVHQTLKTLSRKLKPCDFAIKADLSRYFDTIDRNAMFRVVTRRVRHHSLHGLMQQVIGCESATRTQEERAIFRKSELKRGRGLRQGMPLSPVFAYLFLLDVDQTVGSGFYRYVDDLLFFGDKRIEIEDRFRAYKAAVESRGLKVHDLGTPAENPKTVLVAPQENFDFLGIRLNRSKPAISFEIPSKSKMRIVNDIKEAGNLDRNDGKNQKGWVLSAANKASNLVRNYRSAYHICADWNSFEVTLKALQLNMCRRIAQEISQVEKSKDTELLLRVFGI